MVVMTPKSLLRHKLAVSSAHELTDGAFQTVLDDVGVAGAPEAGVTVDRTRVTRILLCSGKVYYALLDARRDREINTTAIVRVSAPRKPPHHIRCC